MRTVIVIMTPDFGKPVALILSIITHPVLCGYLPGKRVCPQTRPPRGLDSSLASVHFRNAKHLLMAWWRADAGVGRWENEKEERRE